MKKLLFLILPLYLQAQDVPIGSWKDYQSYASATYVAEARNKIYCVSNGGLFYVNKNDNTINRMSKVTGLSDVGIKQIAYSDSLEITVITYDNCNIDIIKEGKVINISDIKRKEIIGVKLINNLIIKNQICYLSCTFGLVLLDIEKEEIKDTYKLYWNEEPLAINEAAFFNDSIHIATSNGLYYAAANSPTLNNNSDWTRSDNPNNSTAFKGIASNEQWIDALDENGVLWNWASINQFWWDYTMPPFNKKIENIMVNNNYFLLIVENEIYPQKLPFTITTQTGKFKHAIMDKDSIIWVADSVYGLLKYHADVFKSAYKPEGPKSNTVFSLEFINDKLFNCHGGYINFGHLWNKEGASIMNNHDSWRNYNYYDLNNARDIVAVASYGDKTYFASYYNGIPELENNEFTIRYGHENTNGALDTINDWSNDRRLKISDLKIDKLGNLWGLNSNVKNPLFVRELNGEWHSFTMNQSVNNLLFGDLLIDNYNQKWGIQGQRLGINNGLFVYDDKGTFDNQNDDQYKLLNTNIGYGNLPSNQVFCLDEDLDGEIWIGTDKGVAVFYDPEAVFSGYNFDAQQILITEGDYGQYLLSEERVKCIAIDGANRKWIGTEKSGIFLLSEDGLEQILHFTKDNSPLFSDNIVDIAINHENGEVFIGTSKGLISYRSDATIGVSTQGEAHVFPNPVNESYTGPIAISRLVADANVKITDINGNLVFETIANGGQAIWNGKNKNNERASTGVYLVFSTGLYGEEKVVSKILFIH